MLLNISVKGTGYFTFLLGNDDSKMMKDLLQVDGSSNTLLACRLRNCQYFGIFRGSSLNDHITLRYITWINFK